MPQLAPGARLRGNKTRADTKIRFPGLPDHPTTRASAPPLRDSAQSSNPNRDGTDFGLLRPMGCAMSSLDHGDCGETSKSNLTRLRAEPRGPTQAWQLPAGVPPFAEAATNSWWPT